MRDFELQFSDKLITPWGGMALIKRMLDHLGFDHALSAADLPQPGSNRGYRPEQLIVQMGVISVFVQFVALAQKYTRNINNLHIEQILSIAIFRAICGS